MKDSDVVYIPFDLIEGYQNRAAADNTSHTQPVRQ